jgi:hypothetical protein
VAPSRIIDVGEGHRTLSWIWYSVQGVEVEMDVSGMMHACICVEWAKARAWALRWREEIFLLDEEMRWVLAFGEWKARWWLEQATRRNSVSEELAEGLQAYAAEHAECEALLVTLWAAKWAPVRARAKATLEGMDLLQETDKDAVVTFGELEVDVDLHNKEYDHDDDDD